jgi:LDH2 family malate/lactate/ureidoglycolate dehydrogenase
MGRVRKVPGDRLVLDALSIAPAEGFTEVLLPGELEWREEQRRLKDGIPLHDVTGARCSPRWRRQAYPVT